MEVIKCDYDMNVFWVYLLFCFIFAVLALDPGRSFSRIGLKIVTPFAILILSSVVAFREGGVDYSGYENIYNKSPSFSEYFKFEWVDKLHGEYGFIFVNSIFSTVDFSFVLLFFCVISLSIVFYTLMKLSPMPALSVLIYFAWYFPSMLSIVRTAVVACFFLLVLFLVIRNRKTFLAFILMISMSVHTVSLVFFNSIIPLLTRKVFIFSIAFFVAFLVLNVFFIDDLIRLIFRMEFLSHVHDLSTDERWSGKSAIGGFAFYKTSFVIGSYFVVRVLRGQKYFGDVFLFPVLLSFFLLLLSSNFYVVALRAYEVLSIAECVLVPIILSYFQSASRFIILIALVPFFIFLFFVKYSKIPSEAFHLV